MPEQSANYFYKIRELSNSTQVIPKMTNFYEEFSPLNQLRKRLEKGDTITGAELADVLGAHASKPLPLWLHDQVIQTLRKTSKNPPGRPKGRNDDFRKIIRDELLRFRRQKIQDYLRRHGTRLEKTFPFLTRCDWWQGPPHERAARLLAERLGRKRKSSRPGRKRNISWRALQNTLSSRR